MPVEKIEKISLLGHERPLYKFTNFQPVSGGAISQANSIGLGLSSTIPIKEYEIIHKSAHSKDIKRDEGTTIYPGPVYLFDVSGFAYFHALYDKVLQYEFIKKYIPNIKIIPVTYYFDQTTSFNQIYVDFLKIYGVDYFKDLVYLNSDDSYLFEEVYNFIFEHTEVLYPFKENIYEYDAFQSWIAPEEYKKYILTGRENLLKTLKYPIDNIHNKKIFVSRRIVNDKYRNYEYGENAPFYYSTRFISLKDELLIEDFFASNGYEIVFPESMEFLDQVSMYSQASHIAGLKSSGFCNMIFSKPGTKIISINLDSEFECWYGHLAEYFDIEYLEVPSLKGEPLGKLYQQTLFPESVLYFEPKETIELIKEHYSSWLN